MHRQGHINELIKKYSNGTISREERFELEKYALDDPMLFEALQGYATHSKIDTNRSWRILEQQIKKNKTNKQLSSGWKIAAAFLVLITTVFAFQLIHRQIPLEDDLVLLEQKNIETSPSTEAENEPDPVEVIETPIQTKKKSVPQSSSSQHLKKSEVRLDQRKETPANSRVTPREENMRSDADQETIAEPSAGISRKSAMNYDRADSESIRVTGNILAHDSERTIPGTKISIAGQRVSTLSDSLGRFSIVVPYDSDTLVFEKSGYQVLRIGIRAQVDIEVRLIPLN